MLYNVIHIKNDIVNHIKEKRPFSLVRIGDGDLKLIGSLIKNQSNEAKFQRSGIPNEKGKFILNIYKNACNNSNYTSSFEMYYTNEFWYRHFSKGTQKKIVNWKKMYKRVGIVNENYCNPEIGYLLFLSYVNLLNDLKEKRICLITCFPGIDKMLKSNGYDAFTIIIPGVNQNHFSKYNEIINKIKRVVNDTDIFLIGGGVLGRGYCDIVKENGGVAVDIGQVMNTWKNKIIPPRFKNILISEGLLFNLSKPAQKYKDYI